ncbi:hypothetical protein [Blautia sp. MSJ-19]|uniref:hypothetical protein n=1 Tax=Blautia sp. MSJ-19 TaxID=2841517 RepID=UPI001C0EDA64|nr:hypothetical protein [Blautia sp. MSJ-19]MBU5480518.1 hypothetical protein [Blautia sp. MSJ-19]
MKHSFRTWFLGVTTVFAMLALAFATYAWFTTNRAVSTSTATARTGEETLELQLSTYGGSSFQNADSASIQQINNTDAQYLLPVSTDDLMNFVYSPVTQDGMAKVFQPVENESYYYHGRVYIRASGTGWSDGSTMKLYLDQSDNALGQKVSGNILNAARLGLVFDGDYSSAVILKLSESSNAQSQQVYNTVINGQTLGSNQVLSYRNKNLRAVTDPSVSASTYTVSFGEDTMQVPQNALLNMQFNKIYTVDIYFYIEGCDPDCSSQIEFSTSDLQIGFYGVLDQKETGA